MTQTRLLTDIAAAAADDLRLSGMEGRIALPGDAAYDRARKIWNGAVDSRPALFALCETREDVQAAVLVARSRGLPLSVRCGGHDFAGRALRNNGLVIDLSRMRNVVVDPKERIAVAAGGATSKDLATAAGSHGLIPVTGNVGAVGMGGLTLGGGYSPLSPKYGMIIDNLIGAEVVLADGAIVTASNSENTDLFWALRGGGGNFGVVTSLRFRLHPVPEVLAGLILFPWSQAESVLRGYADLAASLPEELGVTTGVIPMPDGTPCVMVAPNWHGGRKHSEQAIDPLRRLGTSMVDQVDWMTYAEMLDRFDAAVVSGRHYAAQTRSLPYLTRGTISTTIAAINKASSPLSFVAWHHFRGASTRVALANTAFGLRREHFMMDIVAAWEPASRQEGEVHREWARDFSRSLAPMSLPGGYPNMLSSEDSEQIPFAYGTNIARLLALKKRFDPQGIFTSATPLPSAKAA